MPYVKLNDLCLGVWGLVMDYMNKYLASIPRFEMILRRIYSLPTLRVKRKLEMLRIFSTLLVILKLWSFQNLEVNDVRFNLELKVKL